MASDQLMLESGGSTGILALELFGGFEEQRDPPV